VRLKLYSDIEGFEWDVGNRDKNFIKHKVSWWECEEVFFNQPLYLSPDIQHSKEEERIFALGCTKAFRLLTAVFTVRNKKIRIISARDMNRREKEMFYEKSAEI
jgi:uncharacterized DUF497 family protein